jgi:hypothetical protein
VIETIPCDVDCRYGAWGNCEYDTSNKKWIQRRPTTAPVGAGALCATANTVRDCPNTATNWSDWGAFMRNGTGYGKGTSSEFVVNQSFEVEKQVAFIQRNENQGCPSDTSTTEGNMCYKYRDKFTPYGECKLVNAPNGIANGGEWKKERTNLATGKVESEPCVPPISEENWTRLPTSLYRIKLAGTSRYIGFGGNCGTKDRCENRPGGFAIVCDQARDETGRQLWQTGAYGDKDNAIYSNPNLHNGSRERISYCNYQYGSYHTIFNNGNVLGGDGVTYNKHTKQIRLDHNKEFDNNSGFCWTRIWDGYAGDGHRIKAMTCRINDPNQRFDIVSQSE